VSHPDVPRVTAPLPANLVEVPVVKQRTHFSCGAAATLSLLRFWSVETYASAEESSLYAPLRTTEADGTEPEPMADLLRRSGLWASYRYGDVTLADLERAVDAGEPPIVDLQALKDHALPWRETWDAGHYVVLVGYDRDSLFVADPGTPTPGPYAFIPRAELEERWHDIAGQDARLERMTIFVRGTVRWTPVDPRPAIATRLD
jgi:ABC-type bacteriocin/lantibiotic exporter with double-glycine peptidase domain